MGISAVCREVIADYRSIVAAKLASKHMDSITAAGNHHRPPSMMQPLRAMLDGYHNLGSTRRLRSCQAASSHTTDYY